jgi:plasmid stabilization system protein ParE
MYSVIILPVAAEDIRQIALWYNQKQKGLGKRFIGEIRDAIKYLEQDPKSAGIRYGEVRVAGLKIFPFYDTLYHRRNQQDFNCCCCCAN